MGFEAPVTMPRMRALILGATGLLGQAMMAEGEARGWDVTGAARKRAGLSLDVRDLEAIRAGVRQARPDAIINCAALVDVGRCEADPGLAYLVNARPLAVLSSLTRGTGQILVQISTDHFFTGDRAALHGEDAAVSLVNEYARSKYAGEAFARLDAESLIVRTNIVGRRGWPGQPTFAEWVIDSLEATAEIVRFTDSFASSMHARDCAAAVFELVAASATGTLNVGAREVSSKDEFIRALADELGVIPRGRPGTVADLVPPRAQSLGLDVSQAERRLGRRLPTLDETVRAVAGEHRQHARAA